MTREGLGLDGLASLCGLYLSIALLSSTFGHIVAILMLVTVLAVRWRFVVSFTLAWGCMMSWLLSNPEVAERAVSLGWFIAFIGATNCILSGDKFSKEAFSFGVPAVLLYSIFQCNYLAQKNLSVLDESLFTLNLLGSRHSSRIHRMALRFRVLRMRLYSIVDVLASESRIWSIERSRPTIPFSQCRRPLRIFVGLAVGVVVGLAVHFSSEAISS